MNYLAATRYLQSLVGMPQGFTSKGERDLGWCCSEHAMILSLALIQCGVDAAVVKGGVNIRLHDSDELVVMHCFVLSDSLPHRIFDSSIQFGTVCGVFPDYEVQPVPAILCEDRGQFKNPPCEGIWYFREHTFDPRDHLGVTSKTPYGDWLTSIAMDHHQLWLAAAATTAGILQGEITPPADFPDRRRLCEESASGTYMTEWI